LGLVNRCSSDLTLDANVDGNVGGRVRPVTNSRGAQLPISFYVTHGSGRAMYNSVMGTHHIKLAIHWR
jgi:hypothetical protein